MSQITMDVPVIVRRVKVEGKQHYQIRPLFYSYPSVMHRRFEKAESAFRSELKYHFRGYTLTRQSIPGFLWFRFNPDAKYKRERLEFSIGKKFIRGDFAYAHFDLKGERFVFLPYFNNYMFIAQVNDKGKYDMSAEVLRVVEKLFRQYAKQHGNDINVDSYISPKNEFQAHITCTVKVKAQPYPFEIDHAALFFAAFGGNTEFHGEVELGKVGYDLNGKFPDDLLSAWYREDLVSHIGGSVFSSENSPFVLVGPAGVGKKSIIHEALYRYLRENENTSPELLQKIHYIDPTRVIAGMSIVGMWQKRFEAILKHVRERRKQYKKIKDGATDKIFFDNPVALLRIGKSAQNDMTLSDVLKPYLEKRQLQVILTATPEEWKVVQEYDRRFADLFRVIRVDEPDMVTAVKMVLQRRKLLEVEFGSFISAHAIHRLFAIHRNYFRRQALPGGVMRLLNQMAVKYKFAEVDVAEVETEFEDFSGLSRRIMDDTFAFGEGEVSQSIALKLVGQDAAVRALADTIHMIKAKLPDPNKPKGSFLFIGPTGVGKTQAAKVLSEFMLGGEDQLMRFDMNEFIDEGASTRLIGDSHNPEGQLTGKVRYNPFGIVLLDEIEKAHPKVHDLLLQVLDDGRLTDSLGRTVDFSNTIIIMTSNVGADKVSARVGFEPAASEVDAVYRKAVENTFRPEFVNRIDKIIIFQSLQQEHILGIARLQINELLKRDGFVRRTTILNISEEALRWVSERGFDGKMGGRALKRQIEKDLTALSAEQLITADSDTPVIMDILLKDGRLYPRITLLDFERAGEADWLPQLPSEKQGGRFYGKLLKAIQKIEEGIRDYEERQPLNDGMINTDDDLDWQYYDFKDALAATKEKVRDTKMGFRDQFFRGGPAIPFRLKGGGLSSYIKRSVRNSTRGYRELLRDKLFQKQALNELNEFYRLASVQFDSLNTEFIDNYLDVAFLALRARGFLKGRADVVDIRYQSAIEGKGGDEIKYLMDIHASYFEAAGIQFDFYEKEHRMVGEAHTLYPLMKGEEGIHLFYRPHQTPLPIRLEVDCDDYPQSGRHVKVIRLYDTQNTLTDLRSGLSNATDITPGEFKLMLFSGLDKGLRESLLGGGA